MKNKRIKITCLSLVISIITTMPAFAIDKFNRNGVKHVNTTGIGLESDFTRNDKYEDFTGITLLGNYVDDGNDTCFVLKDGFEDIDTHLFGITATKKESKVVATALNEAKPDKNGNIISIDTDNHDIAIASFVNGKEVIEANGAAGETQLTITATDGKYTRHIYKTIKVYRDLANNDGTTSGATIWTRPFITSNTNATKEEDVINDLIYTGEKVEPTFVAYNNTKTRKTDITKYLKVCSFDYGEDATEVGEHTAYISGADYNTMNKVYPSNSYWSNLRKVTFNIKKANINDFIKDPKDYVVKVPLSPTGVYNIKDLRNAFSGILSRGSNNDNYITISVADNNVGTHKEATVVATGKNIEGSGKIYLDIEANEVAKPLIGLTDLRYDEDGKGTYLAVPNHYTDIYYNTTYRYYYTGKEIHPGISVRAKVNNEITDVSEDEYLITYTNNKEKGAKATITLDFTKGKNKNYTFWGTHTIEFDVLSQAVPERSFLTGLTVTRSGSAFHSANVEKVFTDSAANKLKEDLANSIVVKRNNADCTYAWNMNDFDPKTIGEDQPIYAYDPTENLCESYAAYITVKGRNILSDGVEIIPKKITITDPYSLYYLDIKSLLTIKADGVDVTNNNAFVRSYRISGDKIITTIGGRYDLAGSKEVSFDYSPSCSHIWNDGIVTESPDCKTGKIGKRTFTCISCSATRIEDVPAEHNYVTIGNDGTNETMQCIGCGDVITVPVGTNPEDINITDDVIPSNSIVEFELANGKNGPVKAEITFDVKDATGNVLNTEIDYKSMITSNGKKLTFANAKKMPVITGYTFSKWMCNGKKVSSIAAKKLSNYNKATITAVYTENVYAIQYKVTKPKDNGRTAKIIGKVRNQSKIKYNSEVSLANGITAQIKANIKKNLPEINYKLAGWTTVKNGTTVEYTPEQVVKQLKGQTKKDKKIVLYSVWQSGNLE